MKVRPADGPSWTWERAPLKTRLWWKIKYRGIKHSGWIQYCTDPTCGCCLEKKVNR